MSISLIGLHITIAIILFFTTNFMGKKIIYIWLLPTVF